MRRGAVPLAVLAMLAALAPAAAARSRRRHPTAAGSGTVSLYHGPAPKPGPAILYKTPATAPELTNTGIWHAPPILVSGAEAYRDGEFLYQDWLYDDHGARELPDLGDPQNAAVGDLFSMPNGTYTYPTGPGYDGNAADLVEFRVKPLRRATAFRITLNTLQNPALIAFSIAIGGQAGHAYPFPDGANVVAPASLFLTVRPVNGKLAAQLVHAGSDQPVLGPAPSVRLYLKRHQIQIEVPHRDWNPRRRKVRFAMGVGLWDSATSSYLLPQTLANAAVPGGAGLDGHPAAFFNVAFRTGEPRPSVHDADSAVLDPAWWRDQAQGSALAAGNISQFYAEVSFAKLLRRATDNSQVPRSGSIDMILPSHFQLGQGLSFAHTCGLTGSPDSGGCSPEYLGQLQPYNVYVPPGRTPRGGFGMTLLLHSLAANYNQFMDSNNQVQFALRARPSIVITPEARGPDQAYEALGASDVFEVWAAVARLWRLDPAYTDIAGYSMGGIGTFTLAEQFPDLFARAQPTVGDSSNNDLVASLRNIPVLMWNNSADELVNPVFYTETGNKLASLGYRYELDVYRPCVSTLCSPLFPDHLELAVNDQYAPAAAFLGTATVDRNPAHVTYVLDDGLDAAKYGLVADHAYWLSGLTVRNPAATGASGDSGEGEIDAFSRGFGVRNPTPSPLQVGAGTLTGGSMGPIQYLSFAKTWSTAPSASPADEIDISATNVATATINTVRAHVDCDAALKITTDGPLAVTLAGCHRVVHAG
jgi:hypothetical protein